MPKPSFGAIQALPDKLLTDNFTLEIIAPPAGVDFNRLRLQCQSAPIPDRSIEAVPVPLFGHELFEAGRNTTSHVMSVTFVETDDLLISTSIDNWMEFCRSKRSQHGNTHANYSANALMNLFANTGASGQGIKYEFLWPQNMAEAPLDGSASSLVARTVTFQYDQWDFI